LRRPAGSHNVGIENKAIDVLIVETSVPHTSCVAYNTLSNNNLFATLARNGGIKSRAHSRYVVGVHRAILVPDARQDQRQGHHNQDEIADDDEQIVDHIPLSDITISLLHGDV
jgi:hypothetical protein